MWSSILIEFNIIIMGVTTMIASLTIERNVENKNNNNIKRRTEWIAHNFNELNAKQIPICILWHCVNHF